MERQTRTIRRAKLPQPHKETTMSTNKRTLKKEIRLICGSMAAECVMAIIDIPGADREKFDDCIRSIAELQTNVLRLVNLSFPRSASSFESKKEYAAEKSKYYKASFRKLKADFNHRLEEIIKDMNSALPADFKKSLCSSSEKSN